jgi:glycine/D-amino acid oxidase-like deaminating enzyme
MTDSLPEPVTLRALAAGRAHDDDAVSFKPYWWEGAPRREVPGRTLPSKTDIVIVGTGFTGLSAALTLLAKGRDVLVLDRGVPGYGASTRNGGQIGSGNQKFRVKRLIALYGEKKAAELLCEGTRMLDYIEQLIQAEKIACHFERCGRFRGAMRPAHYEAMARDMEDLRRIAGVESFMVPKAEQRNEIGTDIFYGGSVLPNDASLHPGLYHSGLMQLVEDRGGVVIGNAGVHRITRGAGEFRVDTDAGPVRCRDVLVATNGYTDALVPAVHRRIVTVRSGLIATDALLPEVMARLMPTRRVYGNTNRVFYYFRAAPNENRLVWGGRAGRGAGIAAFGHLAQNLLSVFPELGDVTVTHAWDGQIGYTYDELPHLGRMADGIHYAVGYCGTGVSRATYFGHKIALQIVGDADGRTAFDSLGFPAFPVRAIAQMAVPFVETWFRFRDETNL